jgi:DNA-binding response OmpR family regulator
MKNKIIIAESVLRIVHGGNSLFSRGSVVLYPAASPEDILDLHRTHKADLIIPDAGLDGRGSVSLCTSIRRNAQLKDVSIIMVCNNDDPSHDEYRKAGSNHVLTRPLDPAVLFSTVSRMLMVQNRLAARIPLRIRVDGKDGFETHVGMSRNISVSGLLLNVARPLPAGRRLECTFAAGSRVVTIESQIVREEPGGAEGRLYGVRFLNLDAKTFVLIEHFVKSGLSQPGTRV